MKIVFAFAEGVVNGLEKLNQSDLPLGLVSRVRRVLRNFKEEVEIYAPEREKILREFCTVEDVGDGKKMWKFPLPENERFAEFQKRWEDLQNQMLVFPYEPIDYLDLIDSAPEEVKKKIIAKGSDFEIIDSLNDSFKHQKEQEAALAVTSAGANKAGDDPVASPAPSKGEN